MKRQINLQTTDLLNPAEFSVFKKWIKNATLAEICAALKDEKAPVSPNNRAIIRAFAQKNIADRNTFWSVSQIIAGVPIVLIILSTTWSKITTKVGIVGKWLVSGKDDYKMGPPMNQFATPNIIGKVSNNTFILCLIAAILFAGVLCAVINYNREWKFEGKSVSEVIAKIHFRRMKYQFVLEITKVE